MRMGLKWQFYKNLVQILRRWVRLRVLWMDGMGLKVIIWIIVGEIEMIFVSWFIIIVIVLCKEIFFFLIQVYWLKEVQIIYILQWYLILLIQFQFQEQNWNFLIFSNSLCVLCKWMYKVWLLYNWIESFLWWWFGKVYKKVILNYKMEMCLV